MWLDNQPNVDRQLSSCLCRIELSYPNAKNQETNSGIFLAADGLGLVVCLPPGGEATNHQAAHGGSDKHHGRDAAEATPSETATSSNESALELFEKRILPIFPAKRLSSCTECHLSGVELKDYIQPDQEKTFASLVNAGLVDNQTSGETNEAARTVVTLDNPTSRGGHH